MKMHALGLAVLMCTAAGAVAQTAGTAPPSAGSWKEQRAERKEERREERIQAIKTALQVDGDGAAKVDQLLSASQENRKALHAEMKERFNLVRRAAGGDATAMAQVDPAVQKLRADRAQLGTLNDQLYDQLAQGRTPQQRAALVIAMAGFGEHAQSGRHHHGAKDR